jgi:hypothetical protein
MPRVAPSRREAPLQAGRHASRAARAAESGALRPGRSMGWGDSTPARTGSGAMRPRRSGFLVVGLIPPRAGEISPQDRGGETKRSSARDGHETTGGVGQVLPRRRNGYDSVNRWRSIACLRSSLPISLRSLPDKREARLRLPAVRARSSRMYSFSNCATARALATR